MSSSSASKTIFITLSEVAQMIDHSLLRQTLSDREVTDALELAGAYDIAAFCVWPIDAYEGMKMLRNTNISLSVVIGAPHGTSIKDTKTLDLLDATRYRGIDFEMLVNTAKAVKRDWISVQKEIRYVKNAVAGLGGKLKVIFQIDFLSDEHIIQLCKICSRLKVAYVSVTSGFGSIDQPYGLHTRKVPFRQLEIIREHLDEGVLLKTANQIRTLDDLLHLKSIGVNRVATTSTVEILKEARDRGIADEPAMISFEPIGNRPSFRLPTRLDCANTMGRPMTPVY